MIIECKQSIVCIVFKENQVKHNILIDRLPLNKYLPFRTPFSLDLTHLLCIYRGVLHGNECNVDKKLKVRVFHARGQ